MGNTEPFNFIEAVENSSLSVTTTLILTVLVIIAAVVCLSLSAVALSETVKNPDVSPTVTPTVTATPSATPTVTPTVTPTPPIITEFSDALFRVQSAAEGALAFDNQYLNTSTTVTCIMPNTNAIFPAAPNASSLVVPFTDTLTVTGLKNTIYGVQPDPLSITGSNNVFFGYNSASDVSNTIQLGELITISDIISLNHRIIVTTNTFSFTLATANQGFFCNAFRDDDTPTNYLMFNDSTYEVTYTDTVTITGQALTKVNDTNVTLTLGGSPTTAVLGATQIAVTWSGALSADKGGTGSVNTASIGAVLTSNTASFPLTSGGFNASYLQSRGSSLAPNWVCYGTSFGSSTSTDSFGQAITTLSQIQTGNSALISIGNGTLSGANTAFGSYALSSLTDVAGNVSNCAFGYGAGASLVVGADNVFWGQQCAGSLLGGSKNICFGSYAMGGSIATAASSNIAFGFNTLGAAGFDSSYNIAIGDSALSSLTTGAYNIGIGDNMLPALTTGSYNIGLGGSSTLLALVDGSRNVVVGVAAQTSASATTLNDVTAMGYGSLAANTSTPVTAFGVSALAAGGSASSFTTAFGYQANALNTSLRGCVFGYNTAGSSSVRADMTLLSCAGLSVVQGGGVSTTTTIGLNYGQQACVIINTFRASAGLLNGVALGVFAGNNAVRDCTVFGYKAMQNSTTTSNNPPNYAGVAVGSLANQIAAGDGVESDVMVGYNLGVIIRNQNSVVLGTNIPCNMFNLTGSNVMMGNNIAPLRSEFKCSFLTYAGNNVLGNATGALGNSMVFGSNTLTNITGDFQRNDFLGHNINTSSTSCVNSVCIGMGTICTDNQQIRIGFGTEGNQSCYVDGISGKTTGVADAISVLIDVNGQLGTVSSSQRYKTNVQPLENKNYQQLRPVSYFEKRDLNHATKLYSFIAEEVENVDKNLVCFKDNKPFSIYLQYFPMIMLLLMKTLHTKIKTKEAALCHLKTVKMFYINFFKN